MNIITGDILKEYDVLSSGEIGSIYVEMLNKTGFSENPLNSVFSNYCTISLIFLIERIVRTCCVL